MRRLEACARPRTPEAHIRRRWPRRPKVVGSETSWCPHPGTFVECAQLKQNRSYSSPILAIHVEYAERGNSDGILFIYSLFGEYIHLE